jgi:hypothetical protein
MTLPTGTKFGSYEVLSPVGSGGMGKLSRLCGIRAARRSPERGEGSDGEPRIKATRHGLFITMVLCSFGSRPK